MGLNDTFETAVGNVLMMEPMSPLNKIYSLISRVEKQRSVSGSNTGAIEASALVVKHSDAHSTFTCN